MSCRGCWHYSELKEPRVQMHKDGFVYAIRGYCFYEVSRGGYSMGTAVLVPDGDCDRWRPKNNQLSKEDP